MKPPSLLNGDFDNYDLYQNNPISNSNISSNSGNSNRNYKDQEKQEDPSQVNENQIMDLDTEEMKRINNNTEADDCQEFNSSFCFQEEDKVHLSQIRESHFSNESNFQRLVHLNEWEYRDRMNKYENMIKQFLRKSFYRYKFIKAIENKYVKQIMNAVLYLQSLRTMSKVKYNALIYHILANREKSALKIQAFFRCKFINIPKCEIKF
jgi:hypothetical protein